MTASTRFLPALLGIGLLLAPRQAPGQPAAEPRADVGNIFPTAPRELRQNLSRAQSAIAEERYSDAADELGQVLDNPNSDDYFLGRPGQSDAQQSLKSEALALIGGMPAKGRQIYETKFGFDAKAELDKALEAGSLQQVTDVSRRFFHTKAGYEATLIVGRTQLDQGRPLAAALTLKRLADSPPAAALYDPELSVLLATCWVHARQPEKATELLVALRQRMPQARVKLLDGEESLFSSDDQALAWLERIVGGGRTPLALNATQWVMFRGNETRNASTAGGTPLLNFRWTLPTVNDPQDELKVKSYARSLRDRVEPNIVALQPLVVQDSVIVRAPDSSKLIGVDLRTGKRQWVFPPFDDSPAMQASRVLPPSRGATPNVRDQELKQRVWDDHAFGQVSSDGRQVYVIDDLGYAATGTVSGRVQVIIGPGGRPMVNNGWSKPHNLLVALDLKKQGYQAWAVGGTTGDNPALAGAFFLGPPLPLGDQLYALVEMNSEIRLVCLNAKTGALEWKQQLAIVEDNQQIVIDRVRRLAGASPSYADGVLVCPTSAGAAVAVDLATRSLRWGYQYPRWDLIQRSAGALGVRTSFAPANGTQTHWIDSTATIVDGSAILTPVESQELHCLDVLTGKAKWPPQPRDEMLYIACVHQGKIILIGKNKVKALNLADGKPAWQEPLDLGTAPPAGRGFYTDKYYYLPLANQQLAKIDLDAGQIVSRARTEIDLGNVVCYKDQFISQSAQHVASFFLTEPLLTWIEETLKTDPDNAKALSLKGQVLLQDGKREESLDLLRKAVSKNPEDLAAKSLLVKVMLSLLRDDFAANFALAEELDTLVTDPVQKREVLRWRAQGLAKAGKIPEAFEALVALADAFDATQGSVAGGSVPLESTERELSVRPDRWLQGQLAAIHRQADEASRSHMHAEIEKRLQVALTSDSAVELRLFVNLYGFHPLARDARLALADKLVAADQLLEAELLAGDLIDVPHQPSAGHARATLAALYEKSRRFDLAARYYAELRQRFADVICRDGLTGAQLAEKASGPAAGVVLLGAWPGGRTDVAVAEMGDPTSRTILSQRMQYGVTLTHFNGAALRGLRSSFDPNNYGNIVVRDDQGRQLTSASLRGPDGSVRRLISSYYMHTGKVNGHLVIVNLGDQVVAVDALRAERTNADGLLWRLDAMELDPTNTRYFTPQPRQTSNPLGGSRLQLYDPSGRMNFYTGPVLSSGVCFQKGRQLICADPLTGQSLWERAQIPAAAEIFGDDEFLFVADPNTNEALVLSPVDGSLIGKRKVELAARRWATHGRRELTWEQTGSTITLKLMDAWAQGEPLWTKQVTLGSRGTLIDGEELALLESSGQFTVLSLASGQVKFASPLAPEPSLSFIHVIRSSKQYVLIASQEMTDSPDGMVVHPVTTLGGIQQNRVHGRVYAFDRRSGKSQWQVPAFVAQHCLPPDQPAESPLLVFVRNRTRTVGGNAARAAGSVLCLDRRDGRLVWDSDNETANERRIISQVNFCEIVADPAKWAVTLAVQSPPTGRAVTIQFTDQPTPPQPPAQTGELSSKSVGSLAGTVDRSIDAAFELLNRGINPARLIPRAAPLPARAVPPGPQPPGAPAPAPAPPAP
jgi:outer membrane protein assembly factor BamB